MSAFDFASTMSDSTHMVAVGASEQAITEVSNVLAVKIPTSLQQLLRWRDGGMFAKKRFIIFSAGKGLHPDETLIAANTDRDFKKTFLTIGRDSAFDFGFKASDLQEPNPSIFSHFCETGELVKVADSLTDWIKWAEEITSK